MYLLFLYYAIYRQVFVNKFIIILIFQKKKNTIFVVDMFFVIILTLHKYTNTVFASDNHSKV